MLISKETWKIDTSNETDMPAESILVFDSTNTSTGIVKVNGNPWGKWTGSSSPYTLERDSDHQSYRLDFTRGTQNGQDVLACYLSVNKTALLQPGHGVSPTTSAEVQGSSWTALGQGGNGG